MTKEELYAHPGWECCTFEGAELNTLLLGLKTTFREKLEWLEAAETLTLRLRESRKQARNKSGKRKSESGNGANGAKQLTTDEH